MVTEHRDLLIKTQGLIERTRREASGLREQITAAQATIEHSLRLLARTDRRVSTGGEHLRSAKAPLSLA
jgi:hypothetical protein